MHSPFVTSMESSSPKSFKSLYYTVFNIRSDSQVRAIVDHAQNEARQRRENELVNRVEQAIDELVSQGKKVTVSKVSRLVGMDHKALDRRPHIRELFLVLR